MTISCFPRTETQLHCIVIALKEAGLFNRYEEQAHGERILLSVHPATPDEKERVIELLRDAGVIDLIYSDDAAA
jgi:hypothetical protein